MTNNLREDLGYTRAQVTCECRRTGIVFAIHKKEPTSSIYAFACCCELGVNQVRNYPKWSRANQSQFMAVSGLASAYQKQEEETF